jgi:hypothetical protein
MNLGTSRRVEGNIGYIGVHASLLATAIGLFLLERYIQLLNLKAKGFGPYTTVSNLIGLSLILVVIDACVIVLGLGASRRDKNITLLAPASFLLVALFILLANPL